jgi:uncharacterized RDD family membrane protein YckC
MTRPAAVDGRDPTRVVTRRCVALFVDALLLALVPVLTIAVIGHATLRRGDCPDPLPSGRNCVSYKNQALLVDKGAFLLFFGFLVVLYLALFVVVQGITGASPGKALLGIRVVRADGSAAGPLRSLVRVLAWVVDGLALLVPVALWSAWLTPGHRRVGDWLAGTYVVRRPGAPAGSTTRSG